MRRREGLFHGFLRGSGQWPKGERKNRYAGLPFGQRLIKIMQESGANWGQYFDISLPQTQVYADTPIHISEPVFNLLRHPRLLDIAEQFVGPEVLSNPIQHTRIKPPERMVPSQSHSRK